MTTKWGILATGRIAHTLANAIKESTVGELAAVGSRTQVNADSFAAEYGGITAHGSYAELIADPQIDAIYVSTPHPQHVEWTIKALNAGKAVLCEKPMGLNHAEVMAMVNAAKQNRGFLLEAFMYRMHPQTKQIRVLLESGVIGELRHIHATFAFNAPYNAESRLYAAELGGGGIMDVGCYPVSMTRMIAGSNPHQVTATGKLADTGADVYTAALLSFAEGVGAHVATGVGQQLDNAVAIYGSLGSIHVDWPWQCPPGWKITVKKGRDTEEFSGESKSAYIYQVDEVDRCLQAGLLESPEMNWDDSLGNAIVLDQWRSQLGIQYPQETAESMNPPVSGKGTHSSQVIPKRALKGLDTELSRVVMGCDNQPNLVHAAFMWDDFLERGGNVFDTAHIYGGGRIESLLGQWMRNRGVRNEVVVIGKGAHSPLNQPEHCRPQLEQSLDRLQTDHLDIYFLHRDNPDIAVGEWIDALDELHQEGLITNYGGSNWTQERVALANEFAAKANKRPLSVLSNQFSLARMLSPVWPGCVAASQDEFRAFLERENIALFPWSSQARGFFTDRTDAILRKENSTLGQEFTQPSDAELERCWMSDDNLERRRRAYLLADKYELEPINVALAYVLGQNFSVFPLIGPRFLWETASSLKSFELSLSEEEIAWLDLRD